MAEKTVWRLTDDERRLVFALAGPGAEIQATVDGETVQMTVDNRLVLQMTRAALARALDMTRK